MVISPKNYVVPFFKFEQCRSESAEICSRETKSRDCVSQSRSLSDPPVFTSLQAQRKPGPVSRWTQCALVQSRIRTLPSQHHLHSEQQERWTRGEELRLQSVQNYTEPLRCWDLLLRCGHMWRDPVWWRNQSGDKYVFTVVWNLCFNNQLRNKCTASVRSHIIIKLYT